MRLKIEHFFIVSILILSFSLRFYKLGLIPDGFAFDEAALGYNAWSLILTGRDEWGEFLPLTLRSFDDYKPAVYSYLATPSVLAFGLTEFATRFPAAVFGSLLPIAVFFLIKKLSKNKRLAFLIALVIAISPWHIEVSRTAIEAGVALSLTITAFLALLERKKAWRFLGLGLLIVTLFTYHSARLIVPPIAIAGVLLGLFTKKKRDKNKKSLLFFLVGLFIFGLFLSFTGSSGRFQQISIFNDQGAYLKRHEAIREDGYGAALLESRLFHNKPLSWAQSFAESYLSNTSLEYLFLGGAQPPRVTIPETGQFLLIFLPFFLIGIFASFRSWKKLDQWFIFWLLLAPLPAALTYAEIPHSYRTIFLMIPVAYFIALGLQFSLDFAKSRSKYLFFVFLFVLSLGITFNTAKAWHQYSLHQQVHEPWYRQYGYKQLITRLDELSNENSRIIMTNRTYEPYIYVLFYKEISPRTYQAQEQKRLAHKDIEAGEDSWQLFNYTFSEQPCPHGAIEEIQKDDIFVVIPECETPEEFERVEEIEFRDGRPAFALERLVPPRHPELACQGDMPWFQDLTD